jgi:acetyltransferase-like isoleucine patch superfamily enzyme
MSRSQFWQQKEKLLPSSVLRILQRYFVPGWFVTAYYFLKYGCLISKDAKVQFSRQISFGKRTVVKAFAVIQTQGGRISIGQDCAVSSFNHISTGMSDITVGNYVRMGPHVIILGVTRQFHERAVRIMDQGSFDKGVTIADDVLIGAGATIMPGCRIAEGVVIGSGAVVTKDVTPYSIVGGIPAKVIGERK